MNFPWFLFFVIARGGIGFLALPFDPNCLFLGEKYPVLILCKEGQLLEKAVGFFKKVGLLLYSIIQPSIRYFSQKSQGP